MSNDPGWAAMQNAPLPAAQDGRALDRDDGISAIFDELAASQADTLLGYLSAAEAYRDHEALTGIIERLAARVWEARTRVARTTHADSQGGPISTTPYRHAA